MLGRLVNKTLLLVDDEPLILRTMRRLLVRRGYQVLQADDADQALDLLCRNEAIQVMLCDFRMPGKNGTQLIEQARQIRPGLISLLISGQADLECVVDALNNGSVFKFLTKPWDDGFLLEQIERAFELAARTTTEALLRMRGALESSAVIDVKADGVVCSINESAAAVLDIRAHEGVGVPLTKLLPLLQKDRMALLFADVPRRMVLCDGSTGEEFQLVSHKQDAESWSISIRHRTFEPDSLRMTEVIGRKALLKHISSSLSQGERLLVVYLDVLRFRTINDSLGYELGDLLLEKLARRVVGNRPEGSWVGHMSGDELVLVIPDPPGLETIPDLLAPVMDATRKPFKLGDREIRLQVKMGFARGPEQGSDAQHLLRNAQAAADYAKLKGCLMPQSYFASLNAKAEQQLMLRSELYQALEKEQFFIEYQPKVSAISGEVRGAEALLRWRHPELGLVSPDLFIPMAESIGLIELIGDWVLSSVCEQIASWRAAGMPAVPVAVNISGYQLQDETLLERILLLISSNGLHVSDLQVEITETFLVEDIHRSSMLVEGLRRKGISVALDDFGTGYSSLSYLSHIPVDTLKIDKSFVDALSEDRAQSELVRHVISMAHSMGIEVVAEGVETPVQQSWLAEKGCDELQGYLFSRAISPEAFERAVREQAYRFEAGGVCQTV